jgi:hypothetical protein
MTMHQNLRSIAMGRLTLLIFWLVLLMHRLLDEMHSHSPFLSVVVPLRGSCYAQRLVEKGSTSDKGQPLPVNFNCGNLLTLHFYAKLYLKNYLAQIQAVIIE